MILKNYWQAEVEMGEKVATFLECIILIKLFCLPLLQSETETPAVCHLKHI